MLGEWVKDSHLVMLRNDGYVADESAPDPTASPAGRPRFWTVVRYNFVPEANARLAALQTGKSDVISDLTLDLAKRLEGRPDLSTLKIFPYLPAVFRGHTPATA